MAQMELFSPPAEDRNGMYQFKYTPPFRSTLRPPVEQRALGERDLKEIRRTLEEFATMPQGGPRGSPQATAAADAGTSATMGALELAGQQLYDLVLPRNVQIDLRDRDLFLEIGVDEDLLAYPWELMHDGSDFICEKHFVGRFVNVTRPPMAPQEARTSARSESGPRRLSILLISVPRPQPRRTSDGDVTYAALPEAEAETDAIVEALGNLPRVKLDLLQGRKARWDNVYQALRNPEYDIIHYSGHAHFDKSAPHLSGLVLFDRDMTTGPLLNFLARRPPFLVFVNACESAATGAWERDYDVYSLARAFLEAGSYLIGSRWRIADDPARTFAMTFYQSLVEGRPIGLAMRAARARCRATSRDGDFGWASYLFYGDPRVCFPRFSTRR